MSDAFDVPVEIADVTIVGPLPVPVTGTFTPSGTQDVNIVSSIPLSVTGPLTDTQLRASVVPVTIPTPVPVTDNGGSLTVDGTVTALQGTSPWVVSGSIITSADVNVHDSAGNMISSTGTSLNVDVTNTVPVTGPLTDAQLRAVPVPISGTITANLGTIDGVATEATLLEVEEDLDQFTFSAARLLVDGSGVTQPVSGPLTDAQLRATPVPVSGTVTTTPSGTQDVRLVATTVTQPISAASLPLPAGASTSALQTQPGVDIGDVTVNNAAGAAAVNIQDGGNSITVDGTVAVSNFPATQPVSGTVTANQGTANTAANKWPIEIVDSAGTNIATVSAAGAVKVDGSAVTQPISAASLPLPTGAATEVTLATRLQGTVASSAVTNVAASASNVTLLSSNSGRRMATIYNDSAFRVFVKFGTTASASSFTVRIDSQGYYELPLPCYTGQIDGIWGGATGNARITELS